ncbi:hypothetical protein BGX31_006352, partial [Mortierella sp. GBA43]
LLKQAHEAQERLALQLDQDLAVQRGAYQRDENICRGREGAGSMCQAASVILFQNMVTKLPTELTDTREKPRDTTIRWSHTKDQLQNCEQSYRRRKKDLEETTKHLQEVEEKVVKLRDAVDGEGSLKL